MSEEMSFEELRAQSRGWLTRDWAAECKQITALRFEADAKQNPASILEPEPENAVQSFRESQSTENTQSEREIHDSPSVELENTIPVDITRDGKAGRPRKPKIREVKGETQTSMASSYIGIIKLTCTSKDKSRVSDGTQT